MVTRSTDNGGYFACKSQFSKTYWQLWEQLPSVRLTKHSSWSIITGKTGLAHPGPEETSVIHSSASIIDHPRPVLWSMIGRMEEERVVRLCSDIPIVDNESCHFFYRWRNNGLAKVYCLDIERRHGELQTCWTGVRGRVGELLTLHDGGWI